jgi:hypothetical protein
MAYTSVYNGIGASGKGFGLSKANRNYTTRYFKATHASGDIRVGYDLMEWKSTGGGEVKRNVAYVNKSGAAAGATINATHDTLRMGTSGTISGAANAARFTLETGDSMTPGGTIGIIQIDNFTGSSNTLANAAGIRFTKAGSTDLPYAMAFDDDQFAKGGTASSADGIKIRWHDGATKYLMVGT